MPTRAARLLSCTTRACSFCGKDPRDVGAFVGSSVMDVQICDQCLGICCDVLAEAVGDKVQETPASAWSLTNISATVANVRGKAARGELPPVSKKGRPEEWSFRCGFCLAGEDEVAKLISGPRVFMCESCVFAAVVFNKPSVRWVKRYWEDEDTWFFFEVDADGWVLRQVELQGSAKKPIAAAALAEWPDAAAQGLEAVQAYEAKYGALADQPMSEEDVTAGAEMLTREAFEAVWQRARADIESRA